MQTLSTRGFRFERKLGTLVSLHALACTSLGSERDLPALRASMTWSKRTDGEREWSGHCYRVSNRMPSLRLPSMQKLRGALEGTPCRSTARARPRVFISSSAGFHARFTRLRKVESTPSLTVYNTVGCTLLQVYPLPNTHIELQPRRRLHDSSLPVPDTRTIFDSLGSCGEDLEMRIAWLAAAGRMAGWRRSGPSTLTLELGKSA